MKKLLSLLIFGFMILPSLSFAQVSVGIDPKISFSCVSISNNLSYSSRDLSTGGAVSVLQNFLRSKGYLNSESTGYFGPLTLAATKAFQSANGVLNSGYVGPITRAKISFLTCGTTVIPPVINPPQPIVISEQVKCVFNGTTTEQKCNGIGSYTSYNGAELFPPQFYCSGIGSCVAKIRISDIAKGMNLHWSSSCAVNESPVTTIDGNDEYANFNCGSDSNLPPVINGLDAPTTLSVGQMGTWTVKASDPENGPLSYSVIWGDEYKNVVGPNTISNISVQQFTQSTSFTHSYSSAGVYTVNVTIKDNTGLTSQTSVTVTVGNVTTSSITVLSPNGGESWQRGTTQTIKWQDNFPELRCPEGIKGIYCTLPPMRAYDIKLLSYQAPCPFGKACVAYSPAPYVIARGVNGWLYNWSVDNPPDLYSTRIENGSYAIQVCQSGTSICDSSDSYFKIFSK